MRVIKFRGKDLDTNEWVYGDLLRAIDYDPDTRKGVFTKGYIIHEKGDENTNYVCRSVDIDPNTVGQFIGVYDKNGKEVYEGDIVDCWSEGRHCTNGIVKWMQNRIWIASIWDIWNLMPNKNGIDEGLIVVGNIYDNPELLEGGDQ